MTATDILQEALATTRLNAQRLFPNLMSAGRLRVTEGGHLFESVELEQYDLIVFNAPWITASAHNRAELTGHL